MDGLGLLLRFAAAILIVAATLAALCMTPIARLVVSKSERTIAAYDAAGDLVARHAVTIGAAAEGTKEREGDRRTPEGVYRVCFKNPKSRFHLSLGLDYPSPEDARRGLDEGRIGTEDYVAIVEAHRRGEIPPWKTPLGGEIFIHGDKQLGDATAGCIALDNDAIEEIYRRTPLGTPVEIRP